MDWSRQVRRVGGLLAGFGLLGALVGALLYNLLASPVWGVRIGVGGLIVGLVGSLLLLLGADRLPPGSRPGL